MKLIESKVEIIEQKPGLEGIYKQIEKAGRLCYKSEDKICEGSAEKMVENLMKRGHGSPLEHGTVYLQFTYRMYDYNDAKLLGILDFYENNPYSKVTTIEKFCTDTFRTYVTTYISSNYRVIFENNRLEDLQYICEPTEHHEKRITVKMNCSIGISREFNRHRVNSVCETSTRYCNYAKDKFGSEITFVIPEWVKDRVNETASYNNNDDLARIPYADAVFDSRMLSDKAISIWLNALTTTESDYMDLINEGLKAQEARSVLSLDTATEVMYTAYSSDWEHFVSLRTAIGAHPDARILANNLRWLLESNSLINCTNEN
jgi:thymidylate synthase (FAD)